MHREDFPMLNQDIIYFDNAATTLKPIQVIEKMNDYYKNHTSNIHRGDYDAAKKTNQLYEEARKTVAEFINCKSNEVVFTSGTTMGINMIVFGFMKNNLQREDEILVTKSEHASNILPWIRLSEQIGIKIKYIPLDENHELQIDNIKKLITEKTKVISITQITNVIGDIRKVEEIAKLCKDNNIFFCVDGAQSVPHMKVDFTNDNIDFLTFSGHKMLGPTGVGCLIGKYHLLKKMEPLIYGGGMNKEFEENNEYELKNVPLKFEAGTPAIAEVIGLGEAINYINTINIDKIQQHEIRLKEYLVSEMEKIPNIIIYNKNSKSGIVAFNIKDVSAFETSKYLNENNIYVRSGNHCAKILKNEIDINNTVRISLYLYNTKEEVDKLIIALKNSKNVFNVV